MIQFLVTRYPEWVWGHESDFGDIPSIESIGDSIQKAFGNIRNFILGLGNIIPQPIQDLIIVLLAFVMSLVTLKLVVTIIKAII